MRACECRVSRKQQVHRALRRKKGAPRKIIKENNRAMPMDFTLKKSKDYRYQESSMDSNTKKQSPARMKPFYTIPCAQRNVYTTPPKPSDQRKPLFPCIAPPVLFILVFGLCVYFLRGRWRSTGLRSGPQGNSSRRSSLRQALGQRLFRFGLILRCQPARKVRFGIVKGSSGGFDCVGIGRGGIRRGYSCSKGVVVFLVVIHGAPGVKYVVFLFL